MGVSNTLDLQLRAHRAIAQKFGPPVAGKSQSLTMTASDQTLALEAGATYHLTVGAQPAFIGVADATVAGNREYLPANGERYLMVPYTGLTLHVVQAGTAGVLYAAKLDDVW